ncbi:TonB-dependent receptor [Duganella sp. BJB488]|uniref:TonB-dependent receptor n=1 Tax=unclassified Duganella TaxID=2636909 RepID=UPI000E352690|nr:MULTISPECIES: TonB-dependent receptor [unclassified Duganella]RFP20510.1 TonB-dependent receptor [Duganella sp. BJB489]RFP21052.1 TonB-dependent receptor [Duganella sp. BJB488]RFP33189.1 TonB-dependent receptor [Duganella sp. BJB480]
MKTSTRHLPALRLSVMAASLAAALLAAPHAGAQLSSATIQGQVTAANAAPSAGAAVSATNQLNGYVYRTVTRADGSYVLSGVAPGTYQIKVGEQKAELVTVSVGQTSQVDLALQGGVQQVVITGSATRRDVAGSEIGTSVSREQIEKLPQVTRNFLSFADLAPGVRFNVDNSGNVKVQSGAQNQDNVNVFIDGVSQKNNILRGGVSGLDSSRGNPFPQSAVAEYKVISQNYKAEYDQVSSAAITAVTKSGGNELHGDVFWDHTGTNLTALDPFQKTAERQGISRPASSQDQYGVTLGGPIKQDVAHFFFAYEGKKIDSPRQVLAQRTDLLPNAGVVPGLLAQQGSSVSSFKENLFLLKVDAQIDRDQRVEATARVRRETDLIPEDAKLSVAENVLNRSNDEDRFDFKHEWSNDRWLNEARLGYEKYSWNPHSNANKPYIRYQVSPSNTDNNVVDVIIVGGSPNNQFREQSGTLLQDDLTYTGMAGHTMKGGVKVKHISYDLSGTARAVDQIYERIDTVTGLASVIRTDKAIPASGVDFANNQYGLYFQDDWQATSKLLLNLGLRYDYEDNMLNNSYVTPADRVAIFDKQDPRDGAPAGQTYAQSLAKGCVNIRDYISTGSNRKPFKGAWAPRLGLSYDIKGDRASVLFAGWGRAYDRTIANHALDESQKNAQPGGEIWMIKSDHKMAYTDQFSFGLRQALGMWNGEAGYTNSRSHNQFNWFGGNRDPQGGWGTQSPIDPLWGSVPGFSTLILGDFITEAKTDSAYLKMDKPYTKASTWSLGATYTYSRGETTNKEWTNDIFNWTYGRSTAGWHPSTDVERHRLVVAGVSDGVLPFGLMLSGKLTLGSGLPYRITDCSTGFDHCVSAKGNGSAFHQVDVGVSKEVGFRYGKVSLRADVLNLFSSVNYGGYDGWGGGPGNPQNRLGGDNKNLGTPNSVGGPMRTVKFSARYAF